MTRALPELLLLALFLLACWLALLRTTPPMPETPYYSDDLVELYHGDARDIRAWLEADVLITDPPYGIGGELSISAPAGRLPVFERQLWDLSLDVRNMILAMWGQERARAVFASPKMTHDAPSYRGLPLIWDKGDAVGMGDSSFPWKPSYELIYVAGPGWTGHRGSSVLRHQITTRDPTVHGHPTPKPVALMAELIRKAPPGVIADPFAGSGSTLRAAKDLGRRAIGVEIDERYCEVAARRLAQDPLFTIAEMTPTFAEDEALSWDTP